MVRTTLVKKSCGHKRVSNKQVPFKLVLKVVVVIGVFFSQKITNFSQTSVEQPAVYISTSGVVSLCCPVTKED